jgi:fatty acid desaturase
MRLVRSALSASPPVSARHQGKTAMTRPIFRHAKGARFNLAAIAYVLAMYGSGWWAAFQHTLTLSLISVVFLAHAMCIAAYLLHECLHNLIFNKSAQNRKLGIILMWITGAHYGRFEDLQYKHLRHHRDNADVVLFDHDEWFRRHVKIRRFCAVAEWFYIPMYDYIVHGIAMLSALVFEERSAQRKYVAVAILFKMFPRLIVLICSPRAMLCYAAAYTVMLLVLRFMDAFQHDYDGFVDLRSPPRIPQSGDREYESAHTFSNLISSKYLFLNVLILNFGFHNAHHRNPSVPWYALPKFHRRLFKDKANPPVIPLTEQLCNFHTYRVLRVYGGRVDEYPIRARVERSKIGGNAASFLIPI